MKKNFSFLFALFLMFTGAMNVYADAYPFKITTDAKNPELYAIRSGRSANDHWWTLDATDGTIVLTTFANDHSQLWYFMEVTEGGQTYLKLYPYGAKGHVMSYQDTGAGHTKVWAKKTTEEGYETRWIFDNNGGNAPYGLKTADGSIWLSNYGGASYKFGFWSNGPAGDAGSAMYIEPVDKYAPAFLMSASVYDLQQKYGLVQETSKFYSNAPQPNEGSLDYLLDNGYSTYFHSAWQGTYAVSEKHYLQAEVSEPVKEFSFYFKKRHNNNNNRPVDMTVLGSVDGETYAEIATITSGFPTDAGRNDYLSEVITASEACKFFRFVINETNNQAVNGGYRFFTFSEFYILPNNEEVAQMQEIRGIADFMTSVEDGEAFATELKEAYTALVDAYVAGRSMTGAVADFNDYLALATSNDLFSAVKDASTLAANKQYIVVAAESKVAMAAPREGGATPYRLSSSVKAFDGAVETEAATAEGQELAYMIALEAVEGGWLLKDVVYNKYLLWEEKRSLDLTDDMSKASVFEITINEDGEAKIKLAGENRSIRYSAEDDRFACYTTGQEAVKLYEDATANEFFVAFAQLGVLFNTCQSMWMIPAVNEKAMTILEVAEAISAAGVVSCATSDLAAATKAVSEFVTYAWAMDAKYTEFKDALWACYDLQDNSTASVKAATAFAAVVDKYTAYQWSVPATSVADFDAYIAELNEAAKAYALKAVPADGFTFDNIAVESEWNGTALEKSLTGHLYNPAADAFLTTANSWGTQISLLPNGYKWTVSTETMCDFEWLFDGAEDICAANVGGVNLVPCKVGDKNTVPVAFAEGEDNGIEQTAEGIFLPASTCLFLDLNEEADWTNYTLVYDMKAADVTSNYISLIQTNLNNNEDGDLFINKSGQIGINSKGGLGYNSKIEADQWYKIAVVVEDGIISLYIDGLFVKSSANSEDNRWAINKEGVYFFLDNDGEHNDVEVAGIQLWKQSLDEVAIAQLSGVTEINGEPVPARTAKWTFANADNLYASEDGSITLAPYQVGDNNTAPVAFEAGAETGVTVTEDGIALPKTTCLYLPLNEENNVATYTLVYDLKVADADPFISMFQTDLNNAQDGEIFIRQNKIGLNGAGGLGYNGTIENNKWHRLGFVVKDGIISLYIDGALIKTATATDGDRWILNKEGVFLFLDNDGEHTAVEVGGIQFWKEALTAAHIKAMGAAFAEDAPTKVTVPAASALTYTVSGPLVHPSSADKHFINNGYADGAAEAHTFTLVAKNTYAIQNSKGKYYAYKEGTTVVQMVDKMDENCYWQFVTEDEFRSKFASASYDAPANATFAIPCSNFGYNNAEIKLWAGEPAVGGDYTDYVGYKLNVETCDMYTVVRDMPAGVYRLKVQGFYRQGTTEEATAARQNGTEIQPAKFYANDASIPVMNIIDEAGNNTTSTHGVAFGEYGKAPYSNNDAGVYFRLGLYEHEIVFTLSEGVDTIKIGLAKEAGVANDWVAMDNYRLEYLGAKSDVSCMGSGVIASMTEGDKYVYYTDAAGKHHYLYAAGDNNWTVVDEPVVITFSQGNVSDYAYAKYASFMVSNGYYMSNTVGSDGTGNIKTEPIEGAMGSQKREWESQVFYKNNAGKYAIRITNANATTWGVYKFVNVDTETLAVIPSDPALGDELYIWNISEEKPADVTAIDEVVDAEVANRAYYTLGGVPVDAPVKGVNIVKTTYTNGQVEIQKILVK